MGEASLEVVGIVKRVWDANRVQLVAFGCGVIVFVVDGQRIMWVN
jgi:hypothetical protein